MRIQRTLIVEFAKNHCQLKPFAANNHQLFADAHQTEASYRTLVVLMVVLAKKGFIECQEYICVTQRKLFVTNYKGLFLELV